MLQNLPIQTARRRRPQAGAPARHWDGLSRCLLREFSVVVLSGYVRNARIFGIAHRGGPCRQCRANDAGSNGGWGGHGGARKLRCSEGISAGAGLPQPEKTRLCRHSGGAAGIVSNAVTSFLPE